MTEKTKTILEAILERKLTKMDMYSSRLTMQSQLDISSTRGISYLSSFSRPGIAWCLNLIFH